MTRLLGITVTGGLSSENRVFASLLAERGDRYEALVVVHEESGAEAVIATHFAGLAKTPTVPIDTGWRPNRWTHRGNPGRAPVALRYRRRLDRIINAADGFEPGAVYSSQQHYDCRAASEVSRSLAVPQIVHLHYTVGPWLRRAVLDQLRTAAGVIAVSDFVREQAIGHGVPEHRVTTIHNTMATYVRPDAARSQRVRSQLGLPEDRYIFGVVGRLDPGKGHLDAIAAFERVARQRDDVSLVLVGTGRIERKIRARASGSPAAEHIVMTGQRSDVPELLSVFDALVHPATQDPCPLAVLEAMAAALPVVGYADGGVPELVASGETGVLVGHGDVAALSEAMLSLRDDLANGCELGAAGARRVATNFAPTDAGTKFAELVASIA